MKMEYKEPELNIRKYSLPLDNIMTTSLGGGGTDHGDPWTQSYDTYDVFSE